MKFRVFIFFLLTQVSASGIAEDKKFVSFQSAEGLKRNFNSKEKEKFYSAMSYVGGVGDYLVKIKEICLPYEATVITAAIEVRTRLNEGLIEEFSDEKESIGYVTATSVVEHALKAKWPCN